ncbi:23 kDa integral membrane protein [Drosophila santomea]|uniref:23 kDa integral membrane protein n=1 Tax=Drosophila santomea TaxID=129105 RepID=UPI001952EC83|nr:23 kDa integral membrane protein [Drosophila santomea]
MEKSFPITPWKYGLLVTCILIVTCNVFFFSCGVTTWGSAVSVYGSYGSALCGGAVFGVAFLGMYVALKVSYKYSIYYLIFSGLVIAALGSYLFTFTAMREQLMGRFEERMRDLFERKTHSDDKMQPVHSLFGCCGIEGPQDYLKEEHGALPSSCCYAFDCSKPSHVYEEGCSTKAVANLRMQAELNYYSCMAIIALEFLGLFTAYHLGKARKYAKTKIKDEETPIND